MKIQTLLLVSVLLNPGMVLASNLGTPDRDDIEYPDDEPHSAEEIELGKTLFFDTRLSEKKTQSCATCHNPDLGFGDGLQFSLGDVGSPVGRNTQHIYNLAWNTVFFWDGRSTSLEDQALGPIEAAGEMNLEMGVAINRLEAVPWYVEQFQEVYSTGITREGIGKAIAAFERTIISDNSPFDQYIAGDKNAMSPAAIRISWIRSSTSFAHLRVYSGSALARMVCSSPAIRTVTLVFSTLIPDSPESGCGRASDPHRRVPAPGGRAGPRSPARGS